MIDRSLAVEFAVVGNSCPIVETTKDHDVVVDEHPPAHRADGRSLLQFHVEGETQAFADELDANEEVEYLQVTEESNVSEFRCLLHEGCVLRELTTAGFMPREIRIVDGIERFRGAVVGRDVLRNVIQCARNLGNVELERVAELTSETSGDHSLDTSVKSKLTKDQREALLAAIRAGYFNVPRDATASEVADDLGISKSAFLDRMKRAERTVFEQLFPV